MAVQRLKDETRDLRSELKVLNPQVVRCFYFFLQFFKSWSQLLIGEMLLSCVFSLFILVLQSEDEEPDNDRQMEELQQDSNKKVTLHFINLNMG